ncbi:MAG: JAB domain-containing protein [Zoogloeaceae bacterium]|nr:JAB domain-containing protein [Zoogloeaceae bacterium]
MAITDWPASERPREKLLAKGAAALSDAELLAIFLRVGVTGKSAVDLAREMLDRFGGLRPMLEADRAGFCEAKGLGDAKYAQLQAVLEMARRHLLETLTRGDALESPEATARYLSLRLRDRPQHAPGTIDGASVHPREVVRRALAHNAGAVILAHNHPSGVAEPSGADHAITRRLKEALALIDVRVLDHIVVGDGVTVSFMERGLL